MDASATTIELRHLGYVLAVIQERHYGRAATRLHLTEAVLRKTIHELEDHLQLRLLEEDHRGVTPTGMGVEFAQTARKLLADLRPIRAVRAVEHPGVGGVR